mmetsp:Transcript_5997/g.13116  ORF Transcript_5997/g.13116 Transcript_5997/m.13116 type:complete len:431 (-) Transcript_5997:211-1503(-)
MRIRICDPASHDILFLGSRDQIASVPLHLWELKSSTSIVRLPVACVGPWSSCGLMGKCRLLLRDAVYVAAPQQHLAGLNTHNLAVREHVLQYGACPLVSLRYPEGRHHNATTGHVEVDVRGRQPLPHRPEAAAPPVQARHLSSSAVQRGRVRQLHHLQGPACCVSGGLERPEGCLAHSILRILHVLCPGQQHQPWASKAGEVVYVSVCIMICIQAVLDPDHLPGTQAPAQLRLHLLSCQPRVPVGVEDRLLSGQHSPLSVRVQGSPLCHQPRAHTGCGLSAADLGGDQHVQVRCKLVAVGVKAPADAQQLPGSVRCQRGLNECGPHISEPRVIAVHLHDPDVMRKCSPGSAPSSIGCTHSDRFKLGDRSRNCYKGVLCRSRTTSPVCSELGPSHPTLRMRLPLGRHTGIVNSRHEGPFGIQELVRSLQAA